MDIKVCRLCNKSKSKNEFSLRDKVSGKLRNECKACSNAARKARPNYGLWHKNNKARVKTYMRNYDLNRHYGLSELEYNEKLKSQNYACAICSKNEFTGKGKKAHVDHCHKTGKTRGLLCNQCNVGLGSFQEDKSRLFDAISYLIKYGDTK